MEHNTKHKVLTLSPLYVVQGLPFGFQATALPLYLREQGVSLTLIGLSELLALPWMIKALWGPLVERFGRTRTGHYKNWFSPLQLALALTCASAALLANERNLAGLVVAIFLMNLFTAVMDVAVDGFAVSMLRRSEFGVGNIAQVVGYKLGMLVGGGILVWTSQWIAWSGLFATIAIMILTIGAWAWRLDEYAFEERPEAQPPRVLEVVRWMLRWLAAPGAWRVVAVVGLYKFGESVADKMFAPFLLDGGIPRATIGLWVGTWGMVFSLLGSTAGGWLASRWSLRGALFLTATLRTLPVIGEWALTTVPALESGPVILVTSAEHFFGGALTTALFAYMMSQVDRRMAAAHFTLLASVELLGKGPARAFAGWVADHTGYGGAFGIAAIACILYIPVTLVAPPAKSVADSAL